MAGSPFADDIQLWPHIFVELRLRLDPACGYYREFEIFVGFSLESNVNETA